MIGGLNNRRVLKLLFWVMILFHGEIPVPGTGFGCEITVSGMGQHGGAASVASVCRHFSIISYGI